jgi:hypothetical protein
MEVLKLNIIGNYYYKPDMGIGRYNNSEEITKECVICKRLLYEPTYDNISNNKNISNDNEVLIGKCGHMFHEDCIKKWLNSTETCPIDKTIWHPSHIADSVIKNNLVIINKK